jgi:hypothetical protein
MADSKANFKWMTKDLPQRVDIAVDRIITNFNDKIAADIFKVMTKLTQGFTQNEKPSTKEVRAIASLILESLMKIENGDTRNFLIEVASTIVDFSDKNIIAAELKQQQKDAAAATEASRALRKPTGVATLSIAEGDNEHETKFPTPSSGGRRSRSNIRRSSYKRSNNKSRAKKLKRFISRKYRLIN